MIVQALELIAVVAGSILVARGAWGLWRGASSTALDTLQTANRILEDRVHVLERDVQRLTAENLVLTGKTDFALALAPIMAWAESHELNAAARSDAVLKVLHMIAGRLGAEPDDASGPH